MHEVVEKVLVSQDEIMLSRSFCLRLNAIFV